MTLILPKASFSPPTHLFKKGVLFFVQAPHTLYMNTFLGGYTAMKKTRTRFALSCLIILLMLLILSRPDVAISGASKGLLLWFEKLLPSLLPFIILMNMLCLMGTLFNLSKKLSIFTTHFLGVSGTSFILFLLGIVGGYPMGAKLTKQLLSAKQITLEEAQKSLCFSTNCGPLFLIGTVGTLLLGDTQLGYILFAIHFSSAFIMLLLSRFYIPQTTSCHVLSKKASPPPPLTTIFTQSVQNGMDTIVYVGGYIIFFSMLIALLETSTLFNKLLLVVADVLNCSHTTLQTTCLGTLEFSNGAALIVKTGLLDLHHMALLSALIAFGGICVFFQCVHMLQGTGLKPTLYLLAKCIQAIIAYLLTCMILPLIHTTHYTAYPPFKPTYCIVLLVFCLLSGCLLNATNGHSHRTLMTTKKAG